MSQTVRGRYAPSPTGELHLGNVRTALVAWLATRAAGGVFVMRVEDLDPPRILPGAEERLLEDLRWLGLDWDEGPDVGGPYAPYRQSERYPRYREALERLAEAGRVYGCTCSRADLRRLASAPHQGEEGPIYPGICRERGLPMDFGATGSGRCPALRFLAAPGTVCFEDLLAGRTCEDVQSQTGDFVLRRADGLYAYQLAVVVDDGAMAINQVVRGADLLGSTPRQIQLQEALGLPRPAYAHVPLVLNAEGERLAKRDQAVSIRRLREGGSRPEDLIGELGASLGLLPKPEPLTARELVDTFAWERVRREPWRVAPPAFS
ncbi:MAG TPA: tRNA glutamyl-Q(34) synthetase GluQRS [Oscillatoriaceae cyanobacterium]